MKVSGIFVALMAAAPLASAVPFRMGDKLAPIAREAPQNLETFPQIKPDSVIEGRTFNGTHSSRSYIPINGTANGNRAFVPNGAPRTNVTTLKYNLRA